MDTEAKSDACGVANAQREIYPEDFAQLEAELNEWARDFEASGRRRELMARWRIH